MNSFWTETWMRVSGSVRGNSQIRCVNHTENLSPFKRPSVGEFELGQTFKKDSRVTQILDLLSYYALDWMTGVLMRSLLRASQYRMSL